MKLLDAPNSFIGYKTINEKVCNDLIDFFNDDTYFIAREGKTTTKVNKDIKDSWDKTIPIYCEHTIISDYISSLQQCINGYAELFPNLNSIKFRLANEFNIQKYPKGGGYKTWHCERMSDMSKTNGRVLAFMTYLNDVKEGGETQFLLQKTAIVPKKGLTVIWPSEWTHTHRGVPALNEEKYIATGWFELA